MSETVLPRPRVPRAARPGRRSAWNRFPLWLMLAMGLVIAVNARFIVLALSTFPGRATSDDFDTSNGYNRILSQVDRQNALGWTVRTDMDGATPALLLTGQGGAPLIGASMQATARRPLGNEPDVPVLLDQAAPGRFLLSPGLRAGQWDLLLRVQAGGNELRVTRRVLVK